MVLRPCSSGCEVMAAIPISSSRCQWCAPREKERAGWTDNKVNGGLSCHASSDLKCAFKSAQKSAFLNKVLTMKTAASGSLVKSPQRERSNMTGEGPTLELFPLSV